MCSNILMFLHASNSLYALELLQQDKYCTHGWYLECYNHGSITYHKPACTVLPSCTGWFTCDYTTLPILVNCKALAECLFVAVSKQSLLTPLQYCSGGVYTTPDHQESCPWLWAETE